MRDERPMPLCSKRLPLATILVMGVALWTACEGGGFFVDGRFQDATADGAELAVPESPVDAAPEPAADAPPPEEIFDAPADSLEPRAEEEIDLAPEPEADAGNPFADVCGDLRSMERVYYGTASPTYVPLSPGQVMAVGTWGGCSGTLIAPTWVLTATHCGLGAGDAFCIGERAADPNVCIGTVRIINNPASDQTLGELDADATLRLPGVQPVPIMTESMDSSWIGRTAEAAGYGQQEDGGYGEREFTAEPIAGLSGHTLTIDGEGVHGVCFGDSGGPVFVIASDGTARTAGDLSNGDGSCTGQDNYTRTDTSVAWIESYTGPTSAEGARCGTVDVIGRCSGAAAVFCGADDMLETETCADKCGWDGAAGGFRCITGPDPCGGVDRYGLCAGNVARWCEAGVPKMRDCGACSQTCDDIDGVGAYCEDDPCHGLDYLGRCNGAVAEWCEDGALQTEDCGAQGMTCGYINDEIGYYCM